MSHCLQILGCPARCCVGPGPGLVSWKESMRHSGPATDFSPIPNRLLLSTVKLSKRHVAYIRKVRTVRIYKSAALLWAAGMEWRKALEAVTDAEAKACKVLKANS